MFEKNIRRMKWIYVGAFIDDERRKSLLAKYKDVIPDGWKVYCDHATLAFNDGTKLTSDLFEKYKESLGEEIGLCSIAIGWSDEAIALKLSPDFETANKTFHITLATKPGTPPVRSNFITDWRPLSEDIIKAKIGFFANGKINFNL